MDEIPRNRGNIKEEGTKKGINYDASFIGYKDGTNRYAHDCGYDAHKISLDHTLNCNLDKKKSH